jgi:outer membrane lipoprotein carrier protein
VHTVKVLRRLLPALILVFPAFLLTADPAPRVESIDALEGGAKLHAMIDRVVESQHAVRTLQADFVQLKRSELLLEAVESSGVFLFRAPDLVRWNYLRPDSMVVLFTDDTVTTYHPQQSRAERFKVSGKQRRFVRVIAGMQPLDDLTQNFSVTLADPGGGASYRLTLRPVTSMLKKRLRSVEIEIDRTLFLPVVVEYTEVDGDSTRYEFRNLVINAPIDDSEFRLDLGPGVRLQTLDASSGVG